MAAIDKYTDEQIRSAQMMGSRGNHWRPGKHLATLKATKIATSVKSGGDFCAIECDVKETLLSSGYNGYLTPEEQAAGISPHDQAAPHFPGETCAHVFTSASAGTMFIGHLKGLLVAMKNSAHNHLQAMSDLYGATSEGKDWVADWRDQMTQAGIDLSPDKRNEITPSELRLSASDTQRQPFTSLPVVITATRILTDKKKQPFTRVTYEAASVAQCKDLLLKMAEAAQAE